MKALKFFALFFFALFIVNSAQAQWPPEYDGTKTVIMDVSGYFAMPVMCDDEQVDFLFGPGDAKIRIHYKDGVPIWEKIKGAQNELVSQVTGEVFKVLTIERMSYADNIDYSHFKLKGDQGSMYTGHMKSLWLGPGLGFELLEAEVNCH